MLEDSSMVWILVVTAPLRVHNMILSPEESEIFLQIFREISHLDSVNRSRGEHPEYFPHRLVLSPVFIINENPSSFHRNFTSNTLHSTASLFVILSLRNF